MAAVWLRRIPASSLTSSLQTPHLPSLLIVVAAVIVIDMISARLRKALV
jgi:hypothetical protein